MKFARHALLLIASFAFVYLWNTLSLTIYTVPALGFLVFLYLITMIRGQNITTTQARVKQRYFDKDVLMVFILNTTVFLLIFSTGGFQSSLFFLLYFVSFGIAFPLDPRTVFIFTAGSVLLFLPQALEQHTFEGYMRLGSLVIISPIAYYFGEEFRKRQKAETETEDIKDQTKEVAQHISEDVEDVLEDEKQNLTLRDLEKLDDVLTQTDKLRKQSK